MARFTLTAHPATFENGWVSVSFFLCEGPDNVIPAEKIEAKTTVAALEALIAYSEKAKATGKPCVCYATLDRRDRAPNGWKKARTRIDCDPADQTATMVCSVAAE